MTEHNERRCGDTTYCHKCGRSWDTDDTDPPPCERVVVRESHGHRTKPPVALKTRPKYVTRSQLSSLRAALENDDWSGLDE